MFALKLKHKQEICHFIENKTLSIIICNGCNEITLIRDEAEQFIKNEFKQNRVISTEILDYLCNSEFSKTYVEKLKQKIHLSDVVLVFSCGIGISTISETINKKVITCCDTFYTPGFKGINIPYYGLVDCALCGNCYLNYTGGICPITSCPKSLLNGPCGGAKNGKCEVDKTKECGWEKIILKLKKLNRLNLITTILIHNYNK